MQECIRCGSADHLAPQKLEKSFVKDGVQVYEYSVKCLKCGRSDPYITEDANLIGPRESFRQELELEGKQKQILAGKVDPNSDQTGAQDWLSKNKNPLDANYESRKAAGLV